MDYENEYLSNVRMYALVYKQLNLFLSNVRQIWINNIQAQIVLI